MKELPTDATMVTAGITAPIWLAPLNQWLALVIACLAIVLGVIRISKALSNKDDV